MYVSFCRRGPVAELFADSDVLDIVAIGSTQSLLDVRDAFEDESSQTLLSDLAEAPRYTFVHGDEMFLDHTVVMLTFRPRTGVGTIEGSGCSLDVRDAVTRAVGELVERFHLLTWEPPHSATRQVASEAELHQRGIPTISVSRVIGSPRFAERWPYRKYDSSTNLEWLPAEVPSNGQGIWVPATLLGFSARAPRLVEATTIGVASGKSVEEATVRAVAELVERHALMMGWRTGEWFSIRSAAEATPEVRERLEGRAWQADLLTTRCFGTDVYLTILKHPSRALISIGAGTGQTGPSHSLAEAAQVGGLLCHRPDLLKGIDACNPPRDFAQHLLGYCFADRVDLIKARLLSRSSTPARSVPLERRAEEGLISDEHTLARYVIAQSGGYSVVRVIAEGLQPMEGNEDCARISVSPVNELPYLVHPFN